ncbi:alanine dehydrogenase [Paenibacillus aceris]|uniref:Alanine dehydrogenase n=1 Tax=Paenibacillus aceris TaxID=869555 RepID=A0ABS4I6F7_9BACL|nr:alanine dehydrogenase [Paenibacillus aceris]
MSHGSNIAEAVKKADLLIGTVLIPGSRAPRLVTEAVVKTMKPGSVIVDVAIDQGGSNQLELKLLTYEKVLATDIYASLKSVEHVTIVGIDSR